MKSDQINVINKLKGTSHRYNLLINLAKKVHTLEKMKKMEGKRYFLFQLKLNHVLGQTDEESMKQSQTSEANRSRMNISESRVTTQSKPPINKSLREKNKSESSFRMNKSKLP